MADEVSIDTSKVVEIAKPVSIEFNAEEVQIMIEMCDVVTKTLGIKCIPTVQRILAKFIK